MFIKNKKLFLILLLFVSNSKTTGRDVTIPVGIFEINFFETKITELEGYIRDRKKPLAITLTNIMSQYIGNNRERLEQFIYKNKESRDAEKVINLFNKWEQLLNHNYSNDS